MVVLAFLTMYGDDHLDLTDSRGLRCFYATFLSLFIIQVATATAVCKLGITEWLIV